MRTTNEHKARHDTKRAVPPSDLAIAEIQLRKAVEAMQSHRVFRDLPWSKVTTSITLDGSSFLVAFDPKSPADRRDMHDAFLGFDRGGYVLNELARSITISTVEFWKESFGTSALPFSVVTDVENFRDWRYRSLWNECLSAATCRRHEILLFGESEKGITTLFLQGLRKLSDGYIGFQFHERMSSSRKLYPIIVDVWVPGQVKLPDEIPMILSDKKRRPRELEVAASEFEYSGRRDAHTKALHLIRNDNRHGYRDGLTVLPSPREVTARPAQPTATADQNNGSAPKQITISTLEAPLPPLPATGAPPELPLVEVGGPSLTTSLPQLPETPAISDDPRSYLRHYKGFRLMPEQSRRQVHDAIKIIVEIARRLEADPDEFGDVVRELVDSVVSTARDGETAKRFSADAEEFIRSEFANLHEFFGNFHEIAPDISASDFLRLLRNYDPRLSPREPKESASEPAASQSERR